MVKHLSQDEFDALLEETTLPVVCDFSATWCMPCRMLAPTFEAISEELAGRAEFVKLDVDECEDLARELSIYSVPTVMVMHKNGDEVQITARAGGNRPKAMLRAFIEQNL